VDDLYRLARDHDVPLTWFLDVSAHEPWLRRFGGMVGQEFGVHCYEHVELSRGDVARANLRRARQAMEREGLAVTGCAAPYGIWTPDFARVTEEMGFLYSSEFSFAYDTLPLFPVFSGGPASVLQIPVHPICIGSMLRVGYPPETMMRYFAAAIGRKLLLSEPLFFYHHPTHRRHGVLAGFFSGVRDAGIDTVTMGEFARWWKQRATWRPAVAVEGDAVTSGGSAPDGEAGRFSYGISIPGGRSAIVPAAPAIRLSEVHWTADEDMPVPPELERARDFDPRGLLGEIFSTLSRKFR
jgi:hypothetical protein